MIYLTPNDVIIRRFEASNDKLTDEQEIEKKKMKRSWANMTFD